MTASNLNDPTPLLRAYQAQEKEFVERRFPLQFHPEIVGIRELYNQAKGMRWDPVSDIGWDRFDPGRLSEAAREGARLSWSRRAWGTYPGMGESTALLVRLCLESGAMGMDSKLFLSYRPAEEAKHLEACYMLAERLGGYIPEPGDSGIAAIANHPFAQAALDRSLPVEAFVAALGGLDDQLDLNLDIARLQAAKDPAVGQMLRLMATDKQRHVMFAWTFLNAKAPALDEAGRRAVGETVFELLQQVILNGYRNACLLPESLRARWLEAEEASAGAGLGAIGEEMECRVLKSTVAQVRERLQLFGIELPVARHDELGEL